MLSSKEEDFFSQGMFWMELGTTSKATTNFRLLLHSVIALQFPLLSPCTTDQTNRRFDFDRLRKSENKYGMQEATPASTSDFAVNSQPRT